ncbi:MAG: TetR/AcrR family transcriptional regulator, partial [Colwellia sp.]|nr:TetR/AcrR family transcriptional regulator [Colwellia sp.]
MIKANSRKFSKSALTILNVAESLFAQQGFKATSISEIAKQAGGSKANIYHHFKSKEHLYQEALKLACEDVFNILEHSKTQLLPNPKQRLKEYITLHLENMIEHPDSTNLIKRELMDNNQIEGQLLAKDIFANTFEKDAALVFETYNI